MLYLKNIYFNFFFFVFYYVYYLTGDTPKDCWKLDENPQVNEIVNNLLLLLKEEDFALRNVAGTVLSKIVSCNTLIQNQFIFCKIYEILQTEGMYFIYYYNICTHTYICAEKETQRKGLSNALQLCWEDISEDQALVESIQEIPTSRKVIDECFRICTQFCNYNIKNVRYNIQKIQRILLDISQDTQILGPLLEPYIQSQFTIWTKDQSTDIRILLCQTFSILVNRYFCYIRIYIDTVMTFIIYCLQPSTNESHVREAAADFLESLLTCEINASNHDEIIEKAICVLKFLPQLYPILFENIMYVYFIYYYYYCYYKRYIFSKIPQIYR